MVNLFSEATIGNCLEFYIHSRVSELVIERVNDESSGIPAAIKNVCTSLFPHASFFQFKKKQMSVPTPADPGDYVY